MVPLTSLDTTPAGQLWRHRPTGGARARPIDALTSLRGLLALWIVGYHFWNDALRLFPWLSVLSPMIRIGHMAVPGFFALSGFVLAYGYGEAFRAPTVGTWLQFLGRRLARIYPLHVVTLLVVAILVAGARLRGQPITDEGYTLSTFVTNLLLIHSWVPVFTLTWNYPSWSISSEWFAYLLFPLVASVAVRWRSAVTAVMAAIVCLVASSFVLVGWQPWPFYELVLVVPTFCAGVALQRAVSRWAAVNVHAPAWLPVALAAAAVGSCFLPNGDAALVGVTTSCIVLIGVLALRGLAGRPDWTAAPLLFLGETSYSLYLTHTIAQKVLYTVLPTTGLDHPGMPVAIAVTASYLAVIVAFWLLGFYLVERPARQQAQRRFSAPRLVPMGSVA